MKTHASYILDFVFPARDSTDNLRRLTQDDLLHQSRYIFGELYPHIFAICRYQDSRIKALVRRVKFQGDERCAEVIGACMARHIDHILESLGIERSMRVLVVPVPATSARQASRGWNQCELICRNIPEWSSYTPLVATHLLVRDERTPHQKDLSRKERMSAQRDSFIVNSDHNQKDTVVIVVDDIVTTGATLAESVRVLGQSGYARVIGIAFAH